MSILFSKRAKSKTKHTIVGGSTKVNSVKYCTFDLFMIQRSCHADMFQSPIYPMVRCCSSFIYSLFTHSCRAVFSATLRAQSSPPVTIAGTPVRLPCCTAAQAAGYHSHTQSTTNASIHIQVTYSYICELWAHRMSWPAENREWHCDHMFGVQHVRCTLTCDSIMESVCSQHCMEEMNHPVL